MVVGSEGCILGERNLVRREPVPGGDGQWDGGHMALGEVLGTPPRAML